MRRVKVEDLFEAIPLLLRQCKSFLRNRWRAVLNLDDDYWSRPKNIRPDWIARQSITTLSSEQKTMRGK